MASRSEPCHFKCRLHALSTFTSVHQLPQGSERLLSLVDLGPENSLRYNAPCLHFQQVALVSHQNLLLLCGQLSKANLLF